MPLTVSCALVGGGPHDRQRRFQFAVVVLELRDVAEEVFAAILSKPETEEKRGSPLRNPNARQVVRTLIEPSRGWGRRKR